MRAPMTSQGWAAMFLGVLVVTAGCGTLAGAGGSGYEVWVANQAINKVQILDGKTLEVIAEVPAGTKPHNVTFTADGKSAWVANVGSSNVTVIDTASRKTVAIIPAGKTAHAVTFSPDGKRAYVANPGDGTVSVVDALKHDLVKTISVGKAPALVVFSQDGKKAYVSNGGDATLSVINTATLEVTKTVPNVGKGAMGMVRSTDGGRLVVTGGGENKVSIVDTREDAVIKDLVHGKEAHGIALTADGRQAWVPNRQSGDISIIDVATGGLVATIPNVGDKTDIIAFSPDGTRAFVTTRGQAQTGDPQLVTGKEPGISVIDVASRSVIKKVPLVGGDPHGVATRRVGP
ncbi:MAG: beta-propeller fold lactonase family protein [candidate division NC10 bacterium]|nr:beta-propeller fold lactonase family protein [candidate division NC10 bacterium]